MSIAVPLDRLFDEIGRWGFGYLLTVSDEQTPRLIALRPLVVDVDGTRVLRFKSAGASASRNAVARSSVSLVFPPAADSDRFSLVVDGDAVVVGTTVDVVPTHAVLHRPAPDING